MVQKGNEWFYIDAFSLSSEIADSDCEKDALLNDEVDNTNNVSYH